MEILLQPHNYLYQTTEANYNKNMQQTYFIPVFDSKTKEFYQQFYGFNFVGYLNPFLLDHPESKIKSVEDCKQSFSDISCAQSPIRQERTILLSPASNLKQKSEKNSNQITLPVAEQLDQDYKPNTKKCEKKKKQTQNQERNIVPNIIHQIISYVQKSSKSRKIVEKILDSRAKDEGTVKRFYLYQKFIKQKLNYYVNIKALDEFLYPLDLDNEIFPMSERILYSKISRVLIKNFLESELVNLILTSSKIKGSNKVLHLKAQRTLMEKITLI